MSVFLVDECHLLWGDICGYVWGKTSERVEVPIVNEKYKQTYYGALNYQTKQFLLKPYKEANSKQTVNFVKYLMEQCPGQKIVLIWDGASYHKYKEMKAFLEQVNGNKPQESWLVTCIILAPNAPEQNPVEDIWLQGKNELRNKYYLCNSFAEVTAPLKNKELQRTIKIREVFNNRQTLVTTENLNIKTSLIFSFLSRCFIFKLSVLCKVCRSLKPSLFL
nr:transposase [Anaplasma marginale]